MDGSQERRSHLADTWRAGSDRDSLGNLIPVDQRHEAGAMGYVGPTSGTTVFHPMESGRPLDCQMDVTVWTGSSELHHSHPWEAGLVIQGDCDGTTNPTRRTTIWPGLSPADAAIASQMFTEDSTRHAFRVFAIDRDSSYYIDGAQVGAIDTTITARGRVLVTPHNPNWTSFQHSFARRGPYACELP
jgi:hypothetical protein